MSSVLKAVFQRPQDRISNFILMAFRSYFRGGCPYYRANFREQTFMTFGADLFSKPAIAQEVWCETVSTNPWERIDATVFAVILYPQ